MFDPGESGLDSIARDLASGSISRRTALRRFGGIALGVVLPGALFADSALARCPKERRCHGECCPKHAHCNKHHKCKCNRGYTKCGKHCRDLLTDERNCGSCGHRCPDGKVCRNGHCKPPAPQQVCGNGVREGSEQCDGTDLGTATCASLGFVSGTLACAGDCTYNTSGCTGTACTTVTDCPDRSAECQTATCVSGACQYTDNPVIGQACGVGVGACRSTGTMVCDGNGNVVCNITQVGGTPQPEICGNGFDDDCDGVVDNGCQACVSDTDCASNHCVNGFCA